MNVYGELSGTLTRPQELECTLTASQELKCILTPSQTLSGILTPSQVLRCVMSAPPGISGVLSIPQGSMPPYYEGPFEVTPSTEEQTLETYHLYVGADIKINPIPNNYGLITYNGVTITVS